MSPGYSARPRVTAVALRREKRGRPTRRERESQVHEIHMNHPARNALGTELMTWLDAELTAAGDRPVLLTGTAGAFCAGLDLKELASLDDEAMPEFLWRIDEFAARLFDHPAPTVAWINGHAIAGGCVLALCCDYRVVVDDERTRMGLNEVALGACYPPRILRIMTHRLAARHAREIMLGAQLFGVHDALRLGLVDRVSQQAEVDARAWLERLSAHPRETYRITKAALNGQVSSVDSAELIRYVEREVPIWTSAAMKQRVRAILGGA